MQSHNIAPAGTQLRNQLEGPPPCFTTLIPVAFQTISTYYLLILSARTVLQLRKINLSLSDARPTMAGEAAPPKIWIVVRGYRFFHVEGARSVPCLRLRSLLAMQPCERTMDVMRPCQVVHSSARLLSRCVDQGLTLLKFTDEKAILRKLKQLRATLTMTSHSSVTLLREFLC